MQHSISCMTNSVDPDQPASSDLDLHCLNGNLNMGSERLKCFLLSINVLYVCYRLNLFKMLLIKIVLTFSVKKAS